VIRNGAGVSNGDLTDTMINSSVRTGPCTSN
jgi:hypothetical protein